MKSHYVPSVEFYITNVCNLSCTGCNRFNNYKFSGFQKWNDYKEIFKDWSKILDIGHIGILGGEPLLTPDYFKWVTGLRELWPDSNLCTVTNGYRLNQVPGLYDFIKEHKSNTFLSVGIHNKKTTKLIMDNVKQFLVGPIHYDFDNTNKYHQSMILTDSNNVKLKVEYNWWFHQGSLINDVETGKFSLHNSDPIVAHNQCSMKECYTFIKGKMYKCGVVGILPEFLSQHSSTVSDDDMKLLTSYNALSVDDDYETKETFIKNLPNQIDQCKFCPEVYKGEQIFAEEKKVIFKRNKCQD